MSSKKSQKKEVKKSKSKSKNISSPKPKTNSKKQNGKKQATQNKNIKFKSNKKKEEIIRNAEEEIQSTKNSLPKNLLSVEVLERYKDKYGKDPSNPQQLVNFGKKTSILLSFKDAKKVMGIIDNNKKQKYNINDNILLTKDRAGIIRYYGKVPEIKTVKGGTIHDNWYGIEITGPSLGSCNGSINGKIYFECEKKKGIFVKENEIRRKLTKRDHKRTKSYLDAQKEKEQLKTRGSYVFNVSILYYIHKYWFKCWG